MGEAFLSTEDKSAIVNKSRSKTGKAVFVDVKLRYTAAGMSCRLKTVETMRRIKMFRSRKMNFTDRIYKQKAQTLVNKVCRDGNFLRKQRRAGRSVNKNMFIVSVHFNTVCISLA